MTKLRRIGGYCLKPLGSCPQTEMRPANSNDLWPNQKAQCDELETGHTTLVHHSGHEPIVSFAPRRLSNPRIKRKCPGFANPWRANNYVYIYAEMYWLPLMRRVSPQPLIWHPRQGGPAQGANERVLYQVAGTSQLEAPVAAVEPLRYSNTRSIAPSLISHTPDGYLPVLSYVP